MSNKNISHLNWSPDTHKGVDVSLHTSHFVRQPTFDIDKYLLNLVIIETKILLSRTFEATLLLTHDKKL